MNNHQKRNDIIISLFSVLVSTILILLYVYETFPNNKKWGNLINDTIPSLMAVLIGYPVARLILKPIDLYNDVPPLQETNTLQETNKVGSEYIYGNDELISKITEIIQKTKKELLLYIPDFQIGELFESRQITLTDNDKKAINKYIKTLLQTIDDNKLDVKFVFNYSLYEEKTLDLIKKSIKDLKKEYSLSRCTFYTIKNNFSIGLILVDSKYLIKAYSTSNNDYRPNNAFISNHVDHVNTFKSWFNHCIIDQAERIDLSK